MEKFNTGGAAIHQDDSLRPGARQHLEVGPRKVRLHVGARGAAALAVLLRDLVDADALLLGAVEVGIAAKARLLAGLQEDLLERIAGAQLGDVQRAAAAVEFAGVRLVVLGAL